MLARTMSVDLDAIIVDQHVRGMADRLKSRFEQVLGKKLDETMARSIAFVVLCVKLRFELSEEEALEGLTEGGNDFGVDAMLIKDVGKNETLIALFQCKYHHRLELDSAFPQSGVEKATQAVRMLLDLEIVLTLNPRLEAKVAEVRARVREGGRVPRVAVVLCSNGAKWRNPVQQIIDGNRFGKQAAFEHFNHEALVARMIAARSIDDSVQLIGKSVLADTHGMRAVYGMVPAVELARLMDVYGDGLLDRNVRRYLGVGGIQVNEEICSTLQDPERRTRFHFLNNGLTLICSRLVYNTLQSENHRVQVEGLQLINGGQTSRAIQQVLASTRASAATSSLDWGRTQVQIRLYEVAPGSSDDLIREITKATNHQTPVDLIDLHSGDLGQRKMQCLLEALGYRFHRQRGEAMPGDEHIGTEEAVRAVVAVWLDRPHEVTRGIASIFEELCQEVYNSHINGAQLALAVLLLRLAKERSSGSGGSALLLVGNGASWAAMLMGRKLLEELALDLDGLAPRNFAQARELLAESEERYFEEAVQRLQAGVQQLHGDRAPSATDLSALFRRGDLLEVL